MAHARLSPSDSSRWLNCQFAIKQDDLIRARLGHLPDTAGEAAQLGSLAHEYCEKALLLFFTECDERTIEETEYRMAELAMQLDAKKLEGADSYVERCIELFKNEGGDDNCKVWIEKKCELWYEPGSYGTIDFLLWNYETHTLHVVDYKSGYIKVEPEGNTQLGIYAIAAVKELELFGRIDEVVLGIHQPQWDSEIQVHAVSQVELDILEESVDHASIRCDMPWTITPQPVVTEKGCEWCDHKARCPAATQETMSLMGVELEMLTDEQVHEIFVATKQVKSVLAGVEETIRGHIDDFPGWRLERGRVNKYVWEGDDDAVVAEATEILGVSGDALYKPAALKSYTDAKKMVRGSKEEKALKYKRLEGLVTATYNKDVLVEVSLEEQAFMEPDGDLFSIDD